MKVKDIISLMNSTDYRIKIYYHMKPVMFGYGRVLLTVCDTSIRTFDDCVGKIKFYFGSLTKFLEKRCMIDYTSDKTIIIVVF